MHAFGAAEKGQQWSQFARCLEKIVHERRATDLLVRKIDVSDEVCALDIVDHGVIARIPPRRTLERISAEFQAAVNKGLLDDVDVKKVLAFEHGLHQHLKSSHAALLQKLENDKAMDKDAETELNNAIAAFKKSFA